MQLLVPPRLIVVAYAVAPGPGGPESQVNLELLRALAEHWPAGVTVISGGERPAMPIPSGWRVHALGEHGPSALSGAAVRLLRSGSLPLRAVEKLVHLRTGQGIKMLSWQRAASRVLELELDREPDAVVWSRALPFASVAAVAAITAVSRPLRWIVNLNDPMPASVWPGLYAFDPHTARRTRERFAAAIPRIGGLTFPSARLRNLELAAFPELARVPSEVLPHIARPAGGAHRAGERLRIAFAGTLRKDRARPELAEALARLPAVCEDLEITFHLARPTPFAEGYAASLGARIVLEEDEEALARSLAEADVLLDLECEADRPLLLTKVVNYLAAGRPVWALTAPESTTRDLVEEGWGYASPLGDPAAVAETLARIHGDWSRGELESRAPSAALRERFSPRQQIDLLLGLLERMAWLSRSP